jgi:glycosyltransferase involved in cell wall biosynthesis
VKLSVIIPVYNEVATVEEVVRRVRQTHLVAEIILVDDGSTDGTREALSGLASPGDSALKILLHERNRGKGAAIRSGLGLAQGDVVLIQDADLEYDPRDYAALLKPFDEGALVVYGSRFLQSEGETMPLSRLANRWLTWATNLLFGAHLTDMETGYKLFRRDVIQSLDLHAQRFEFEPEVTAKLLKRGIPIREVPIRFRGRSYAEGKKIRPRDALVALWTLLRIRFGGR